MNSTEAKQSHSPTPWSPNKNEIARIVTILNNHDVLVAALESMTEIVEQCAPMYEHALSKARAALKQAKEVQP